MDRSPLPPTSSTTPPWEVDAHRVRSNHEHHRRPGGIRKRVNQTFSIPVLIPEQAVVVREMADRFLAGQSLRSITKWLNEESGMPSPRAGRGTRSVWYPTTVKSILTSARISGQRAYQPTLRPGETEPPQGREILGPGNWEPIITPEETARIRAVFAGPDRRVGASSINLLSAIATCGRCGAGLVAGRHKDGRGGSGPNKRFYYRCAAIPAYPERGGLTVAGIALNDLVRDAVIARLAATELPATGESAGGVVGDAMGRITAARQRMEDMARDYGAGLLTRGEYHAGRTAAQHTVRDAELLLGKVNRGAALTGLPVGDEAALRHAWDVEWSVPQKRAILTALIDTLTVYPVPKGTNHFRPDRVQLIFKA
ncbi:recombinase family protein [Microbacterium sp. 18062]|uniref:recombinase family protein n=1 Tax=Microbacterium sp. 18062 TaxID=2681410 RepID=UPI0027D245A6|nr:recombinase family protein [Microbacterium sp. 18062]